MKFRHTVESRVVGILIPDLNSILGWVVNTMTQVLYPQENAPLLILQKAKNRVYLKEIKKHCSKQCQN
jgi:hypothetical protein